MNPARRSNGAIVAAAARSVLAASLAASLLTCSAATVRSSSALESGASPGLGGDDNSTSFVDNPPSDHDSLMPLRTADVVGFACAALGLVLTAGGGIGGGGILVPIYILVLGFLPKHAIPLSNVTVFGGAVANTLLNARRRHPLADRPLIDWDLILVMEPPTLAGTLVGANLNKFLPETAITIMLVLLLTFTAYSTLKKARSMHRKETSEIKLGTIGSRTLAVDSTTMAAEPKFEKGGNEYLLLDDGSLSDEDRETSHNKNSRARGLSLDDIENIHNSLNLVSSGTGDQSNLRGIHHGSNSVEEDDTLQFNDPISEGEILEKERHTNRRNVLLIVVLFLVILAINILKGGGGFRSPMGIECGTAAFWAAQAALLLWILLVFWIGRRLLLKDAARKLDAGYRYLDEDLRWDRRATIVYPLISVAAGLCAGMFGIGGGIVKGPLMLAMGVHPAVASATSACMILFTSFTAATTFAVYGLVVRDYAAVGVVLGFVATLLGQTAMSRLLARSGRSSYIAFSIGFVVLLSAVLMTMESVLRLVAEDDDEEFRGLCETHLDVYHHT